MENQALFFIFNHQQDSFFQITALNMFMSKEKKLGKIHSYETGADCDNPRGGVMVWEAKHRGNWHEWMF